MLPGLDNQGVLVLSIPLSGRWIKSPKLEFALTVTPSSLQTLAKASSDYTATTMSLSTRLY
jgi:hypothetical protein